MFVRSFARSIFDAYSTSRSFAVTTSSLSSWSITLSSSGRDATYASISSAGGCSSAMDETGMAATDRNIAAASRPEIIRFAHLSFSMSSSFRTCSGFHVSLFVCAWHIPSCHHGYALLSGTTPFIPSVYPNQNRHIGKSKKEKNRSQAACQKQKQYFSQAPMVCFKPDP